MMNFDVAMFGYAPDPIIFDVRGGEVRSATSNTPFNNLHIPYRGQAVDFNAPHRDGTGAELKYLPSFVNLWNISDTVSLEIALKGLTAKEKGIGGSNGQNFFQGMTFSTTI